jgi:rfaE bifunctional protein nucleotidyltransferase chain/domain
LGEIIRDWTVLAATLNARRQRGEKVVTTNGVFDVLHVGHARYLQAARALGDLLVVGINTDAGTRRLKGPERPFVLEDERAELIAALGCVDYVTLFDEHTPEAWLAAIRTDIHTKGGDYDPAALPETVIVERGGGRVVTLPFVAGRSTTNLVDRIRRSKAGPE